LWSGGGGICCISWDGAWRIMMCLPVDLRHSFSEHEAHTEQWAGFKDKKNGELIRAAEAAGYDEPDSGSCCRMWRRPGKRC